MLPPLREYLAEVDARLLKDFNREIEVLHVSFPVISLDLVRGVKIAKGKKIRTSENIGGTGHIPAGRDSIDGFTGASHIRRVRANAAVVRPRHSHKQNSTVRRARIETTKLRGS